MKPNRPNPEIIKQLENAVLRLIRLTDEDQIEWKHDNDYSTCTYWVSDENGVMLTEECYGGVRRLYVGLTGRYDMPVNISLRRKLLSAIKRSKRRKTLPQEESKCLEFILNVAGIQYKAPE